MIRMIKNGHGAQLLDIISAGLSNNSSVCMNEMKSHAHFLWGSV